MIGPGPTLDAIEGKNNTFLASSSDRDGSGGLPARSSRAPVPRADARISLIPWNLGNIDLEDASREINAGSTARKRRVRR
jgi:hypothetical protein